MGAAEQWECSCLPGWVSERPLCRAWGSRAARFCFFTYLEAFLWLSPLLQRGSPFLLSVCPAPGALGSEGCSHTSLGGVQLELVKLLQAMPCPASDP